MYVFYIEEEYYTHVHDRDQHDFESLQFPLAKN